MGSILNLVSEYGYILIYGLLCIELMGVPFLPGEILIVYCGFLVFQGKLNLALVILSAGLGVLTGMSISYFIGKKLGSPFFHKYGKKVHLGPEKIEKFSGLLNKYGTFLIMVICFIPGLKHVIGYLSGISDMKYKKYAAGSFVGALIWAGVFVTIGDVLGDNWKVFHKLLGKYLVVLASFAVLAILIIYLIKIYRHKILEFIKNTVILSINIFHSLGRLRIVVVISAILGILLIDGFINIIQGLLSNEFTTFNEITYYIMKKLFTNSKFFNTLFYLVNFITLDFMYIVSLILIIIFIVYKAKDKKLEIKYALITILGGLALKYAVGYVIRLVSQNISLFQNLMYKGSFTAIVIYGFLTYILVKHINLKWLNRIIVFLFFLICIVSGMSELYTRNNLSQVLAGFSLGGVWLSLNIVLLEITRIMPVAVKRKKSRIKNGKVL